MSFLVLLLLTPVTLPPPCPGPDRRPAKLIEGCPAPYPGWLYDEAGVRAINADFTKARALVSENRHHLREARRERDECRLKAADVLSSCAEPLDVAVPKRALWPWLLAGSASVAAPVGVCSVLDCGPGYVPWLAAGVNLLVVAGLSWVVE